MDMEIYNGDVLDREFADEPEIRARLDKHRIIEPYAETKDYAMRLIPGDRRDIMALPAACVSGSANEPWYLDVGVNGDDGAVYIGAQLFYHLAKLVGYCDAEELKRLRAECQELRESNDRLRNSINAVRIVRADLDRAQAPERNRKGAADAA